VRVEERRRQEASDERPRHADQRGDDEAARVVTGRDGLGDCAGQKAEDQKRDDARAGLPGAMGSSPCAPLCPAAREANVRGERRTDFGGPLAPTRRPRLEAGALVA
jgi:hypothetical protein